MNEDLRLSVSQLAGLIFLPILAIIAIKLTMPAISWQAMGMMLLMTIILDVSIILRLGLKR